MDVENTGVTRHCAYCGKSGKTISVGDLAKAMEAALDEHYYQTPVNPEGIEYIAVLGCRATGARPVPTINPT